MRIKVGTGSPVSKYLVLFRKEVTLTRHESVVWYPILGRGLSVVSWVGFRGGVSDEVSHYGQKPESTD